MPYEVETYGAVTYGNVSSLYPYVIFIFPLFHRAFSVVLLSMYSCQTCSKIVSVNYLFPIFITFLSTYMPEHFKFFCMFFRLNKLSLNTCTARSTFLQVIGEEVWGERAAQQVAREAQGPHQVNGGGRRPQVVGQIRLHRSCHRFTTWLFLMTWIQTNKYLCQVIGIFFRCLELFQCYILYRVFLSSKNLSRD